MPPMANTMHQRLKIRLMFFLEMHWGKKTNGRVYPECNLVKLEDEADWTFNFRGPDLQLVTREQLHMDKGEYIVGAPLVVVEIRSLGDRSYDKLGFYSELGVKEAWIIDRSSRFPEIFELIDGSYEKKPFDADGWLRSTATGVKLRRSDDGLLRARFQGDDATIAEMPED